MIRSCLVLAVTTVSDTRVCISGLDSERLFPVVLWCDRSDLDRKNVFFCSKDDNGLNRHLIAFTDPSSDDDYYFRLSFPYKVDYVFYKCKDGKFRAYLR